MASALVTPVLVSAGRLETESPNLCTFRGKGLLQQVTFYTLVETTAQDNPDLCSWAARRLRDLIGHSRGSLTSALLQAVQGCHQELLAANQQGEPQDRVGLGITCLALRTDEVYLATAGPSLVYVLDGQGVRNVGVANALEGAVGLAASQLPVNLHRLTRGEAGAALVAMSSLSSMVTLEGVKAVLTAAPQEALTRLQLLVRQEPSFAALLVTWPKEQQPRRA
ncbi:MAG: hypothetical protein HY683_01670 [Chloroflexi bacterium]|nr:hypothetical protein [Chloroflexota bacterium]